MLTTWMASQAGGADPGPPPADYTVSTDAELTAAVLAATNGQIIELTDAGTFTAQANINGKTGITLRGQTYGVPHLTAGLTITSSTNCKLLGLKITRTAPNANSNYDSLGVIEAASSSGLEIAYCEVSSNPLAGIAMQAGTVAGQYFQGYRGINGLNMASFNFHHNTVHDTFRGFSVQVAAGSTGYIEYNSIYDCYQNPCEMAGLTSATLYFRHNDFIGTWAISTDTGSPHSSVLGFSATVPWTPIVVGNILIAGMDRRFAAKGTYAAASGPKFNDTTSPTNAMHYTNGVFAWNIVTAQDGIGLEISLGNFAVFCNTVLKDSLAASSLVPAHHYHDIGAGSYCCKNIFPNHIVGTLSSVLGGPNGINSDYYTLSWDNPILRPDGLGGTVAGDLNCYDFHLTGPTFTGWTVANIVGRVTPKVGSYFATDGIGAVGTGYDWTTRSYSSFPTFTKPKTSNASGTTPALTQFDATNDWLQMSATAPYLDVSNRRTLTMAFYATADNADTVDCYYSESAGSDFTIRRLPASSKNIIRYRFKNNANVAICEVESGGSGTGFTDGFGQRAADGSDVAKRLWVFSVNLTTGRYFIMRGKELDPFPLVTTLKPDDYANIRTAHAIMGQSDLTPPTGAGLVNGRLGLYYYTDEFVDLSVAANHDDIVATDGTPADWGSDGSNFTGTQPRGFVKGDATAINAGGGINLGSSPDKWIINGSVTNA